MSKVESADLLIKLYDLRREETMRTARNWIFTFSPTSAEEIGQTMMDPEVGGYLRMVGSYWDMVASFVNHGAIDAEMFNDCNGEHLLFFAKIQPHLADMRETFENPDMYKHLEKVITDAPNGAERLTKMKAWLDSMAEGAAEETDSATA